MFILAVHVLDPQFIYETVTVKIIKSIIIIKNMIQDFILNMNEKRNCNISKITATSKK